MKVKITRPDGIVIEAEGSADEIERIAGKSAKFVPFYAQPPFVTSPPIVINPQPWPSGPAYPAYPWDVYCSSNDDGASSTSVSAPSLRTVGASSARSSISVRLIPQNGAIS